MRKTLKIAKAELYTLFYSPIAWFILIIFAFQTGMVFMELMQSTLKNQLTGMPQVALSANLYGGQFGLLIKIQEYLHLYLPLLTMGLMSREYSSGSIKLLFSSPVNPRQIILGKFIAMMGYGLLLTLIILAYVLVGAFTIENYDITPVLIGVLGIYLLICAYAAIGLFMSSLTSYQVVAALGTLVVLSALAYMNKVWQDMEFVREITYWLSLSGRSLEFAKGLICSEDVLYFVIVTGMFLGFSVLRVRSFQTFDTKAGAWGRYALVAAVAMTLGYVTSRPMIMAYYDGTRTKYNTLTPNSQEVVAKLEGGLTITTYVNLLDREYVHGIPSNVKADMERLRHYIRFKPETKMKYVYYYDKPSNNPWVDNKFKGMSLEEQAKEVADLRDLNFKLFMPPAELKKTIDLTDEGNTFVRVVERENGQKAFLRIYEDFEKFPSESEITAALKRMVMKLPRIGFLQGHGEPTIKGDRIRDYSMFSDAKTFRYALTNQGCDVESLDISGDQGIPEDMDIVVISDMDNALSPAEEQKIEAYIAKGGNLMVALKPGSKVMNDFIARFGIGVMPGRLVQPKQDVLANVVLSRATAEGAALNSFFQSINDRRFFIGMENAASLIPLADKGFVLKPILRTDSVKLYSSPDTLQTWNELETRDFVNDSVRCNPAIGEQIAWHTTAMGATRDVAGKQQRVFVLSDAGTVSNGGLNPVTRRWPTSNFSIIPGIFNWLSDGKIPVDVTRPFPTDNTLEATKDGLKRLKMVFTVVIPVGMLLAAAVILIRRKRR
ncbi:Gldg family protein [Sphingobacterium tabacisoli]|uniref:Gldg family protein n=1 Tax=Sphingobacterium tabacisoli TaxID=2044855 RepID=A0ABW5L346_9SPHI|nr:Gldg family protein [Sphingobacterium tabacisoli]